MQPSVQTANENQNEQETTFFFQIPNEAVGLMEKKILTPSGATEKIDANDLIWWGFFYTFLVQGTTCYQTRKTISDRFDCSPRTVTRHIERLKTLGLLNVEERKGTSNIYTATTLDQFLAMRTQQPKQKPTLRIVRNEEKPDEPEAEFSACVADLPALPDIVQATDQSAGELRPDPILECVDGLDDVPLTEAPEGFDEVKAPSALTLNENEIEIANLQNQHSEVEEKIRKFDWWLKGKDVEKMIRFASDYGLTRESPQAIRDLVNEKLDNAVRLKNRLEIELESHGIFDHIEEGVY